MTGDFHPTRLAKLLEPFENEPNQPVFMGDHIFGDLLWVTQLHQTEEILSLVV